MKDKEEKKTEQEENPWKEGLWQAFKAMSILSGVGVYFVVVVAICVYLGHLADTHFGLGNAGKFIGILAGFPIAIYSLWRQLKHGLFGKKRDK